VLSVRGRVLENGMPRFFRRFSEGVFDVPDVKFRANELADFVVWASRRYGFLPGSVVALGYSNGANIGAALILLRPEILDRAILFRATAPFVPDILPDLNGKSVLIAAGTRDSFTPVDRTKELGRLLTEAGAEVTFNWEEAGHSLTQRDLNRAKSWLVHSGAV